MFLKVVTSLEAFVLIDTTFIQVLKVVRPGNPRNPDMTIGRTELAMEIFDIYCRREHAIAENIARYLQGVRRNRVGFREDHIDSYGVFFRINYPRAADRFWRCILRRYQALSR